VRGRERGVRGRERPGAPGRGRAERRTRAGAPAVDDRRAAVGGALATAASWLTLVLALAGLHPVLQGVGWWVAGAVAAAVVLVTGLVVRALGAGAWVAWGASALVGVGVVTVTTSGGTAWAGVVPSPATLARLDGLADSVATTVVEGTAPVVATSAVVALVVAATVVLALVGDLVGVVGRAPALAGAAPLVVLVVPSFVPGVTTSWPWVVAALLAHLARLAAAGGRRPGRSTLAVAVAAVAVAGLVTAALPPVRTPVGGPGTGTGLATGVNPIVDLGDDLRRGAPVTVLTYRSTDPDGQYLKLVDLVDFSGERWSPADVEPDPDASLDALPPAPGVAEGTTRREVTTEVEVGALRSPWLPLPVPPTEVTGLDDDWVPVEDSGVTVRSERGGTAGLEYEVRSDPVDPTPSQVVATLGADETDMGAWLSTDGVPEGVAALAAEVTASSANPFDAAVALQDFFREGDFRYSEDTPVEQGYDGSGLDVLETFLEVRRGYCVHFASAMAVMARTLGIPSRVAVGFLPGSSSGVGEDVTWSVSSDDLHTWPELWFDGLGWVPFEPTVGLGAPQEFLQETGVEPTDVPSPEESDAASEGPSQEPSAAATSAAPTDPADGSASGVAGDDAPGPPLGGLLAVLLVLLLAAPAVVRGVRRGRRLGAAPPGVALPAWRELVDTAADLGLPVSPTATPSATAAALGDVLGRSPEARGALTRIVAALEHERFADALDAADVAAVRADAGTVLAGLRRAAGPRARVRAALAPRSLVTATRRGPGEAPPGRVA